MTAIEGGSVECNRAWGGGDLVNFIVTTKIHPPSPPPLSQGINNDRFPTVTYKTNVLKRGGVGCIYVFK